jgi:hypothetical protein
MLLSSPVFTSPLLKPIWIWSNKRHTHTLIRPGKLMPYPPSPSVVVEGMTAIKTQPICLPEVFRLITLMKAAWDEVAREGIEMQM